MLRVENIKMQGFSTLYSATLDGLKTEEAIEVTNDLAGIDMMPIVITISLVINVLSIIAVVFLCQKWKVDWLHISPRKTYK